MAKDREIMEAGTTETYEEEISNGEGSNYFLTTKAAWRDGQGNILGIIAIARNINDRKQAEEASARSQRTAQLYFGKYTRHHCG